MRAGDCDMARADRDGHAAASTILKVSLLAARPRARKEILVPGNAGSGPRRIDKALILALARPRSWIGALRRGNTPTPLKLRRASVSATPMSAGFSGLPILRPTSSRAIVEGRQPRSLTVKLLLHGIPLAWSDQRVAFGFSELKCRT
jgi:hypothetical protein